MLRLIRRGCGLGEDAADLGLELGVKRRNGTGPVVLRMLNSWASLCKVKDAVLSEKVLTKSSLRYTGDCSECSTGIDASSSAKGCQNGSRLCTRSLDAIRHSWQS
jgi:hypothetical protein